MESFTTQVRDSVGGKPVDVVWHFEELDGERWISVHVLPAKEILL